MQRKGVRNPLLLRKTQGFGGKDRLFRLISPQVANKKSNEVVCS